MADANLTPHHLRELLEYDSGSGVFTWKMKVNKRWPAGMAAGRINKSGYRYIAIEKRDYLAHRLAWLYVNGAWPVGQIDHINGCRDDNRITNLRDVSATVNSQNLRRARHSTREGGLLGAYRDKSKWKSAIVLNGEWRHLGTFDTEKEAHDAYLAAKRSLHAGCTI